MAGSKKIPFAWGALIVVISIALSSCNTIDLYEKTVPIPGHQWQTGFKPQFPFTINDTTVNYDFFIVLRHNEKYNYNNIWVNLTVQPPGDTAYSQRLELTLADNEKGWLGSAMDDLYEHRVRVTPPNGVHLRKGEYQFTISQIMRDDPLDNVMNVGLRIEKKTP
jgi:gliding motility-associated lipoprotein GldH